MGGILWLCHNTTGHDVSLIRRCVNCAGIFVWSRCRVPRHRTRRESFVQYVRFTMLRRRSNREAGWWMMGRFDILTTISIDQYSGRGWPRGCDERVPFCRPSYARTIIILTILRP
jgi:hypothetical protein